MWPQLSGRLGVQVGDVEHFLEHGPGFIFLFHPCLGPLWDIIAQKVRGGALTPGSELILEVSLTSCRGPIPRHHNQMSQSATQPDIPLFWCDAQSQKTKLRLLLM